MPAIEDAIADIEIGDRGTGLLVAWLHTAARVEALATARESGDYTRQAQLLPTLIPELNAAWTEIARGLATSPTTRDDAVAGLVRAEALAPHHVRAHPLLRETVRDLLRRVPRDRTAGREVHGLAFRMGIVK